MKKNDITKGSFIRKKYQVRFIARFVLTVLIGAAIFIPLFYFYTYMEIGEKYSGALLNLAGLLKKLVPAILLTSIVTTVLVCIMMWIMTLVKSNKIAGPIYRLERSFESIGEGDLKLNISFRKDDAIGRLSDATNEAAANLYSRFNTVKEELTALKKELESEGATPGKSRDALARQTEKVKEELSEFIIS